MDAECFGTHHAKTVVSDASGEGGASGNRCDLEITWGEGERFDLGSLRLYERGPNRLVRESRP